MSTTYILQSLWETLGTSFKALDLGIHCIKCLTRFSFASGSMFDLGNNFQSGILNLRIHCIQCLTRFTFASGSMFQDLGLCGSQLWIGDISLLSSRNWQPLTKSGISLRDISSLCSNLRFLCRQFFHFSNQILYFTILALWLCSMCHFEYVCML